MFERTTCGPGRQPENARESGLPHGLSSPGETASLTSGRRSGPSSPFTQTAIVVGPPGQEIFTDKYGRVKVQFNWDRQGQKNEHSSCWIRVVQPAAGSGSVLIPRVGWEVAVSFEDGDPDEPIILGRVFNPENMPEEPPRITPDP